MLCYLTWGVCTTCAQERSGSTHELSEVGIVLMGNNVPCKTTGMGSIRMKIFDERV